MSFASQLKERNLLWRTFTASNGRWLLNRIINIESHQVEDGFFIKLPILGLAHDPLMRWDRDRSWMLWLCPQKTTFSKFFYFFFGGGTDPSVFIRSVLVQPARGHLCDLVGLSGDADCITVTTKPINPKRGRTRKAPQGCAGALEASLPLCKSLTFPPDFTESN